MNEKIEAFAVLKSASNMDFQDESILIILILSLTLPQVPCDATTA